MTEIQKVFFKDKIKFPFSNPFVCKIIQLSD